MVSHYFSISMPRETQNFLQKISLHTYKQTHPLTQRFRASLWMFRFILIFVLVNASTSSTSEAKFNGLSSAASPLGHKHGPDLCKKGACKNTILSSRDPHYSLKENVKQKIQRSKPKKHAPYAMLNICFSSYSGKENKCVKNV